MLNRKTVIAIMILASLFAVSAVSAQDDQVHITDSAFWQRTWTELISRPWRSME